MKRYLHIYRKSNLSPEVHREVVARLPPVNLNHVMNKSQKKGKENADGEARMLAALYLFGLSRDKEQGGRDAHV